MRRAPHPGQSDVPSDKARAQDGQLKTFESASPMARPFPGFGGLGLASKMFEVTDLLSLQPDASAARGPALARRFWPRRCGR